MRAGASEAGFTLFEALLAVAIMGVVVTFLATVTGQWLPNWNRGLLRVQQNERVAIALDRLAADLSAAEYVSVGGLDRRPLFEGEELGVVFVRSAVGPNSHPGLEIVRIAERSDRGAPVLVRMRARYMPSPPGSSAADFITFSDPVVLLGAPFRVAFAYAGSDGEWTGRWRGANALPRTVRFIVRDAATQRVLARSTAAPVHVDMAAPQPQLAQESSQDSAQTLPGGSR